MLQVYGIPNCNSMAKTFAWLGQHGVAYNFVNYKKNPPTAPLLQLALANVDAGVLLNKKGTTWKKLSPAEQAQAGDAAGLIALLIAQPSLIKRPLLVLGDKVICGYDEQLLAVLCGQPN